VEINMQDLGCAHTTARMLEKECFPKLVSAELIWAFAIIEPDAGSDVMSVKSAAKGNHWLLDG
jgi:glutaryl-CoA dehydrogenase (non-decarboxylating)